MDHINKILHHSLSKKGLMGVATSAEICFWAEKLGNGSFKPISYSRGILKVSVSSAPAASELQIKQEDIITQINQKIGRDIIKQIRIVNLS